VRGSDHRRPSRFVTLGIVGGLHVVGVTIFLLQVVTRDRSEALPEAQQRVFLVSFPEITEVPPEEAPPPVESPGLLPTPRPAILTPSAPPASAAITLPPEAPRPPIDWQMELKRSAQAMLDRETDQERQRSTFGGHPEVPEALRPPPGGEKKFAWSYRANRFGGGAVQISEHCSLILGIIPVCRLGKIPVRGDLFAQMQKFKAVDQASYPRSRSLEPVDQETRLELQAIERLLGKWRAERGSYPHDLLDLVAEAPALPQGAEGRLLIVDAWQNKVMYRHPSGGSVCDYDLYSLGPNGIDDHGTRDDIVSCGSTPDLSY
jgi:type II secretion system (T2SS) protein G